MSSIRVTAIAIVRHPDSGDLLVDEFSDPHTGQLLHRPPGGGVNFGELSRDAVVRELLEEYGLEVDVHHRFFVMENLFTFAGRTGHELALVHRARLIDPKQGAFTRLPNLEGLSIAAVWRGERHHDIPLVPERLELRLGRDEDYPSRSGEPTTVKR